MMMSSPSIQGGVGLRSETHRPRSSRHTRPPRPSDYYCSMPPCLPSTPPFVSSGPFSRACKNPIFGKSGPFLYRTHPSGRGGAPPRLAGRPEGRAHQTCASNVDEFYYEELFKKETSARRRNRVGVRQRNFGNGRISLKSQEPPFLGQFHRQPRIHRLTTLIINTVPCLFPAHFYL